MSTGTVLKRAALLEYAVVRAPLQLLDEQVVRRYLDESSALRRLFEQALGVYDKVAESWHADDASTDEPDEDATVHAPAAEQVEDATVDAPAAEQVEELAEELIEEQQTETFAGELADNDDLRHVQAELEAKRLLAEQGE